MGFTQDLYDSIEKGEMARQRDKQRREKEMPRAVNTIREILLPFDEEQRVAILLQLGICLYCGDNTNGRKCYCRADD